MSTITEIAESYNGAAWVLRLCRTGKEAHDELCAEADLAAGYGPRFGLRAAIEEYFGHRKKCNVCQRIPVHIGSLEVMR